MIFKAGNLVRKKEGSSDLNQIGIVLEVVTNDLGNSLVKVLSENRIRIWYSEHVFIELEENELSIEQLDNVCGGMSHNVFSKWRADTLNSSN
jgi:hypothetical protein